MMALGVALILLACWGWLGRRNETVEDCMLNAVYRVHCVVTYPKGHEIYEKTRIASGEHWKEREVNATKWDVVVAPGVEQACALVRSHYERDGAVIRRIWSLNHLGDLTLQATEPA